MIGKEELIVVVTNCCMGEPKEVLIDLITELDLLDCSQAMTMTKSCTQTTSDSPEAMAAEVKEEDRMSNTAYNIATSRATTVLLIIFVCHQYANLIYSCCQCIIMLLDERVAIAN